MHDTAAAFGAAFFRCYADVLERARILEVGAGDVNGTLRGCAPYGSKYTGIDLEAGPGVDIVLSDPYTYPFEPETYDIVVSSSCLEHDQMFWLSFAEMCRVLRAGGFIYLNAPSNGKFHRYPTDNWRFYPDSGLALVSWGRRNGHDIHLIESFIGRRRHDVWNDCVMVFGKGDTPRQLSLLADLFPRSLNIRVGEQGTLSNYCEQTEDMTLQAWMTEKLRSSPTPNGSDDRPTIEALITSLAEREVALGAAERAAAERSAAEIDGVQAVLAAREAALEEREGSLHRAEAEAAGLRTALDERDAALQQAQAETADLRTALDEHVQQAGRQIVERDAAVAMLQAELAAIRTAVARAEDEVGRRTAASALMEAEIDELRRNVASLQHEAAEHTAARAQMQVELVSLRDELVSLHSELATARHVGRSLLAALKTGPLPASESDEPARQAKKHFLLTGA